MWNDSKNSILKFQLKRQFTLPGTAEQMSHQHEWKKHLLKVTLSLKKNFFKREVFYFFWVGCIIKRVFFT